MTEFVSRHENQAIVDAILTLARELSIKVTAEGVETVEQAVALRARRCDNVQGYLLSKPRPAAEVEGLIRDIPKVFRDIMPAWPAPVVKVVRKQNPDEAPLRRGALRKPDESVTQRQR